MRLALGIVLLFTAFVFPSIAKADTSVAVVDVKKIMSESAGAKSISEQREELKTQYLSEISKKEQALRDLEKEIMEQIKSLPEDQRLAKRQSYEKALLETRNFTQNKKRMLEEASREATNVLRDTLYVVVQELANENGYDLVISNQNVITGKSALDITGKTMEMLDERLPAIPLELSEE